MSKSAARKVEKSVDAYRSIGEAAEELGLQPHVLRYWESKFGKFVKPLKRRDGRRMFRPEDLQALRAIQLLVHDKGMTLKGAGKLLEEQGIESVSMGEALIVAPAESVEAKPMTSPAKELQDSVRAAFQAKPVAMEAATGRSLETVLADLTDIKRRLDAARLRKAA